MTKRYTVIALFLCLIAGFAVPLGAQTLTIGTGGNSQNYPVHYYWGYSFSEAIYLASDMTGAGWGGGNGYIANVRWNVATAASGSGGTIKIYMYNTTATTLSSGAPGTQGTLVWSGAGPAFNATGWFNFTLTTPFFYLGGSNLYIRVERADNTYYTSYPYFYYTSVATLRHASAAQDGSPPPSVSANYNLPNVQLVMTTTGPPAIILTGTVPQGCVQNVNQTVTASLYDNGTIADARIWFRKNGGSWYNAGPTSIAGNNYTFTINHTLMGTVAGDAVDWYLAAMDNNSNVTTEPGGGSGSTVPVGSTPPSTFYGYGLAGTIPVYQSFDGSTAGFNMGGTASNWRIGTPVAGMGPALSTPNTLCMQSPTLLGNGYYYNDGENSYAVLPPMSFTGMVTDPVLVFSHKYSGIETCCDGGWVEYSVNGGSSWNHLGTMSDPQGQNWYNNSGVSASNYNPVWNGSTTGWSRAVRTLTGLAGQACVLIRFRFGSDGSVAGNGWIIDDLAVGNFPQKDVSVNSATMSYAQDRWAFVVGQQHKISAEIQNAGWEANPSSVTLVYKFGSAPVNSSDGVAETFTPTWAAGKATLTFSQTYTPPSTGAATLYVRAFYTNDGNAANDQVSKAYTIQGIKVFGFEDFQSLSTSAVDTWSPGWAVVNGGNPTTFKVTATGMPSLGSSISAATVPAYDGQAFDDWIFSPAALLQAGSSYRLQFKYSASCGSSSSPVVLDVAYGLAPNAAAMTTFATWSFTTPTCQWIDAIGQIGGVAPYFNTDPLAAQNYYIGWHLRSPAGTTLGCALDDIILDENPSPPPKIGIGAPGTPNGQHIDNPATPLVFSAIFKKPGTIAKVLEVVSTTYNYGAPGDFLWDVTTTTSWIKLTKSTAAPRQYPSAGAPNGYNPPRCRQLQTFTLEVDPTGFGPGTYTGKITLYASLYNSTFPAGIKATNEPFVVTVQLTVTDIGSGVPGTPSSYKLCKLNLPTAATPVVYADGMGNPFAAVTVKSGTIPSLCIEEFPNQLPSGIARYRYVQKYWQVTGSGTGWTADIDWYYSDAEAAAGGVTRPDLLRCVRQTVVGGVWQDPTQGVTSTSYGNLHYVHGATYNPLNIGGNHCVVTSWITPKANPVSGSAPAAFGLEQNYPNPFNPSTSITVNVAEETAVRVVVYNGVGDEVAVLVDEVLPAGAYTVPFDGRALSSGTYTYRMTAGDFVQTRRMVLAK
jgi:hypothetical protein